MLLRAPNRVLLRAPRSWVVAEHRGAVHQRPRPG